MVPFGILCQNLKRAVVEIGRKHFQKNARRLRRIHRFVKIDRQTQQLRSAFHSAFYAEINAVVRRSVIFNAFKRSVCAEQKFRLRL